MSVYFSSVDNQELRNNSQHYMMYLSVIVNNNIDIIARVAITTEVEREYENKFSYRFFGKKQEFKKKGSDKSKEVHYWNCEVFDEGYDRHFHDQMTLIATPTSKSRSDFSPSVKEYDKLKNFHQSTLFDEIDVDAEANVEAFLSALMADDLKEDALDEVLDYVEETLKNGTTGLQLSKAYNKRLHLYLKEFDLTLDEVKAYIPSLINQMNDAFPKTSFFLKSYFR